LIVQLLEWKCVVCCSMGCSGQLSAESSLKTLYFERAVAFVH